MLLNTVIFKSITCPTDNCQYFLESYAEHFKSQFLLFSARLRRAELRVCKVFARLQARKNLTHSQKKARLRARPGEKETKLIPVGL